MCNQHRWDRLKYCKAKQHVYTSFSRRIDIQNRCRYLGTERNEFLKMITTHSASNSRQLHPPSCVVIFFFSFLRVAGSHSMDDDLRQTSWQQKEPFFKIRTRRVIHKNDLIKALSPNMFLRNMISIHVYIKFHMARNKSCSIFCKSLFRIVQFDISVPYFFQLTKLFAVKMRKDI